MQHGALHPNRNESWMAELVFPGWQKIWYKSLQCKYWSVLLMKHTHTL